jgi:hypothetical protein
MHRSLRELMRCGRRSFIVGTAAGATLASLPFTGLLRAGGTPSHRFVSLYFDGAWDVLLGPDARDPSSNPSDIDLGTDLLPAAYRDPIPVNVGGTEVLWGAAMAELERHADVLTLFRGVNMNTVAHAAGASYVNTFIPPAGVVPKGDSIATRMTTASDYGAFVLPNVAIGMPSYNVSFGPEVTGIGLRRATEIVQLVEPLDEPLSPTALELLRRVQDESPSCVASSYADRPADGLAVARARTRDLLDLGLGPQFDFAADADLQARYGIVDPNQANDPAVIAATTWRLFELGLATSVTARLQRGLDTHGPEWATDHAPTLQAGFDALAALLDDLRDTDPTLQNTTVLAYSEFGRTPDINGRGGRDHWFASSVLVFGGNLRRGVFGATVEDTLGLLEVDIETGLPAEGGEVIRPEHIGATLAAARGLSTSEFRASPLEGWIDT